MAQAVELYFDQTTEREVRRLLDGLSLAGVQVTNQRPHVSLGVFDDLDIGSALYALAAL